VNISMFLSYPKRFLQGEEKFLFKFHLYFESHGLAPRTLAMTDYDMNAPLKAIRSMMLEFNDLFTIGFR
jgi:hypothetical protein